MWWQITMLQCCVPRVPVFSPAHAEEVNTTIYRLAASLIRLFIMWVNRNSDNQRTNRWKQTKTRTLRMMHGVIQQFDFNNKDGQIGVAISYLCSSTPQGISVPEQKKAIVLSTKLVSPHSEGSTESNMSTCSFNANGGFNLIFYAKSIGRFPHFGEDMGLKSAGHWP